MNEKSIDDLSFSAEKKMFEIYGPPDETLKVPTEKPLGLDELPALKPGEMRFLANRRVRRGLRASRRKNQEFNWRTK